MDAKIAFQLVAEAYKALDAWQWNWSHKDFLTEAIDFSKDAKVIEEGVYDFALNEGSVKVKPSLPSASARDKVDTARSSTNQTKKKPTKVGFLLSIVK